MSLVQTTEQIAADVLAAGEDTCPTCGRPRPVHVDEPEHLPQRRRQILAFIRGFITEHSYSPTVRDITAGVGLESPSTVQYHLGELERAGYIQRAGYGRARALRLVDEPPAMNAIRLAEDFPDNQPLGGRQ